MSLYVTPWCRNSLPPLHDSKKNSPNINSAAQTALYTFRSASIHNQARRVVLTYIIRSSPTSHMTKPLRQAQPSHDALPTSPNFTQLHHNHNASSALATALCATSQQTTSHLTLPQHPATPLQPSRSYQARGANGQCLQPEPSSRQGTCQRIRR